MQATPEQKLDQLIQKATQLEQSIARIEQEIMRIDKDMAQHKYQAMIWDALNEIKRKLGIML